MDALPEETITLSAAPANPERKYKLCIGKSVGDQTEHTRFSNWSSMFCWKLGRHEPRIETVFIYSAPSPRILLNRNMIVEAAINGGADFLLMVDPDMEPDYLSVRGENGAFDFWRSSFGFMLQNPGCVIGAPALSGHPSYEPNVWRLSPEGIPVKVTPREAARQKPCIEEVFAIGSGLMLIDLSIFSRLPQPWFDDIYEDKKKTKLKISQDFYFCRSCGRAEIPVLCNWAAWSRHWKYQPVERPELDEQILLNNKPLGAA